VTVGIQVPPEIDGPNTAALRQASIAGIASGAVYDFLTSHCAVKTRADALYSWNIQHFNRFGSERSQIVRIPN
jgi:hypothetical protein